MKWLTGITNELHGYQHHNKHLVHRWINVSWIVNAERELAATITGLLCLLNVHANAYNSLCTHFSFLVDKALFTFTKFPVNNFFNFLRMKIKMIIICKPKKAKRILFNAITIILLFNQMSDDNNNKNTVVLSLAERYRSLASIFNSDRDLV